MKNLAIVLRFAAPYLGKYWGRMALGLLLGVVFGLSNAAILASTKALLTRMFPGDERVAQATQARKKQPAQIEQWVQPYREKAAAAIDPWLPAAGRKLDSRQLAGVLVLLPLMFAFRGYVGFLSSYCLRWVSERVVTDLRQQVFDNLSKLSVEFYNKATMGDLISHVMTDTNLIQRTLNHGVSDLVKEPITILSTIAVMLWVDWQLTLFVAGFLPICLVPIIILGRKVRLATRANRKNNALQTSLLVEALSGIRVIKAYHLEAEQLKRFAEHSRALLRENMRTVRAKELINPLVETIGAIGVAILIIYILAAAKSGADLALFLGAVMTIYTPVKNLGKLHTMFVEAGVGVERIMHILAQRPTVVEPLAPKALKPFAREIAFEDVSFGYDSETVVLKSLNLRIPRGMKLGVVGESGSGKSTLVNLLMRFYDPVAGRVTVDGVDIREVLTSELRAQMAMVSQEIVLFDLSVAENIACGRPGATRAEVEAAAKDAFAHNFIMALPNGYDTRIGERGVSLSGGQRQRLAIARAFIRNAPILILDEATASLDSQSEAEVQRALAHLAEHRTVISVAHRLATLSDMDWIIVLASGQIVEQGGFDDLLERKGMFAELARRQGMHAKGIRVDIEAKVGESSSSA